MAFRDFTYPEVEDKLKLTLADADLYSSIPPISDLGDFPRRFQKGADVAIAINTEKARSEFIIAPILLETRTLLHDQVSLFSGIELNVDSSRGLNGFCDFIITRSPMQSALKAPIATITEAKNDNIGTGMGQCIAAMVAAREFNAKANPPIKETIHGVVTTGGTWKFLRLIDASLTVDSKEYYLSDLARILGILVHILTSTETAA